MILNIINLFLLLSLYECQYFAPPIIQEIQRIRLDSYRVRWSTPNAQNSLLTKNRILLFYGSSSIEWPSQAVRIDRDGSDSKSLESFKVSTYIECIQNCLSNSQCHYIVKSGDTCFLKASTPVSGPCAKTDECAVVLEYKNEATLYDLPINVTFKLQVQVYDSSNKVWSFPSDLSSTFNTNFIIPKISNPIEQIGSSIRIKWTIADEIILKPIRYRLSLYRKYDRDLRDWPAQIQPTTIDGVAQEYLKIPIFTTSSVECTNACLRDARCLLAVRDTQYCYLKDNPSKLGTCGPLSECWSLKPYQSYTELANFPYNEIYRFQVSIFDQYTQKWSPVSEFSNEFNTVINLVLSIEKIDSSNYKLIILPPNYPISKVRVLVSKSDSDYVNDLKAELGFNRYNIPRNETSFSNDSIIVNVGKLDEIKCFQLCNNDLQCLGFKIKNGNCYTTTFFDPFTDESCLSNEKCYSVSNFGNESLLQNLDSGTNYKVRVLFYTKYNTRGFSNEVQFTTTNIIVGCLNGIKCLNNGFCSPNGQCQCQTGYYGNFCEYSIGCTSCLNGGSCNLSSATCSCVKGYIGANCSIFTGCLAGGSFSCQNGGTCLNINGIGVCACLLNGFSGTYCSTPLGCNFTGCLNGGFCITSTGTCSCLIGYTGSTCSSISGCSLGFCQNGGVCQETTTGFFCICIPGYTGVYCQNANVCSSRPCLNGGTCSTGNSNIPICTCAKGFYGQFCALTSACAENPCLNGGTCLNQASYSNGYFCACQANYFGINCQEYLSNSTCFAPDSSTILCSYWASLNYCSYHYTYNLIPLPVYCPLSCKTCNQVQSCVDSQISCAYWAASGLCVTANNINQNLCRKSCNNCAN